MNGEISTQNQQSAARIEPTAADVRDIAQQIIEQGDKTDPKSSNDSRLAALEQSHADLIAKLSRHFPALF